LITKDLVFLLIHLLTTLAKLLGPGGAKSIVADSLLMKQQLLIIAEMKRRNPRYGCPKMLVANRKLGSDPVN